MEFKKINILCTVFIVCNHWDKSCLFISDIGIFLILNVSEYGLVWWFLDNEYWIFSAPFQLPELLFCSLYVSVSFETINLLRSWSGFQLLNYCVILFSFNLFYHSSPIMATKALTSEAIFLTEKKMDMTLSCAC